MSEFARAVGVYVRQHGWMKEGARVLVALSGGPDSCALLLALCEAASAGLVPAPVAAAHYHHGLRGRDADEDAAFAAALASRYGLPCVVGIGTVPSEGRSPNDSARRVRYDFLLEAAQHYDANILATAHTADDQAETVLGRVLRGTSVDGLAGIPAARPLTDSLTVVRPLLGCRRADIEAYCQFHGITPRHDPSNEKDRYARSRLRKRLPDLARDFNPRLTEALNRLSEHAALDTDLLNTLTDELAVQAIATEGEHGLLLDRARLRMAHPALRRRVLIRALRRIAGNAIEEVATAENVAELERALLAEETIIPNDLPHGIRARQQGDTLRLERLDSNAVIFVPYTVPVPVPGSVTVEAIGLTLTAGWLSPGTEPVRVRHSPTVDLALSPEVPLIVRAARPGDRIAPLGMGGKTRLVRDLMAGAKWPQEKREHAPLLLRSDTEEILWVVGLVQAESTRIDPGTIHRLRLTAFY